MNVKLIVGIFVAVGVFLIPAYWIYQKVNSIKQVLPKEEATYSSQNKNSNLQQGKTADSCKSSSGKTMTFDEAKKIAIGSDCTKQGGQLKDQHFCNENSGTWWIDLDIQKPGCNPACVVSVDNGQVEINWRCTGLMQ